LRDALGLGAQRACFTQARMCAFCALGTLGARQLCEKFQGEAGGAMLAASVLHMGLLLGWSARCGALCNAGGLLEEAGPLALTLSNRAVMRLLTGCPY
jgi:hypothetical protein